MSTTNVHDDLNTIIQEGICEELAAFMLSQATIHSIINHRDALLAQNYGNLFGQILVQASSSMELSLMKIFDSSKSNRSRSIPEALRILAARKNEVVFKNEVDGRAVLPKYGIKSDLSKEAMVEAIVDCVNGKISAVQTDIDTLKQYRDTQLAHRDLRSLPLPPLSLGQINAIASVVETFLDLTGILLFGTRWIDADGRFIVVSQEAPMMMAAFRRLMEQAKIRSA